LNDKGQISGFCHSGGTRGFEFLTSIARKRWMKHYKKCALTAILWIKVGQQIPYPYQNNGAKIIYDYHLFTACYWLRILPEIEPGDDFGRQQLFLFFVSYRSRYSYARYR